jgi:hypothetical protein
MIKKEKEKAVLVTLNEITSEEMPDSQALLMVGFANALKQNVLDMNQSEHFANEVDKILK